ncbi:MAG: RNA 3'-terminal phosphate cyclase [Myxococcales bacterium]|nr:RNA 3'-terminal phosphate cyclase [Myxococcales bacterium]
MITIDGTTGEGGGQVLRSSLTLSLATQKPFTITNIRKKRGRPGLLRQHLASTLAAEAISNADVTGARMGSTELVFRPGRVTAGEHTFKVGTAGSCLLVLATVLLPLSIAEGPSRLVLEGGTHNPAAPPFPFVAEALLPTLAKIGYHAEATLVRPGFFPAGGGRVEVAIAGGACPSRIELLETGKRLAERGRAIVSALPSNIALRELETLASVAGLSKRADLRPEVVRDPVGPGNALVVTLVYEQATHVVTGFGEKGAPAERIGGSVGALVAALAAADVPVCEHLADQLVLPLALGRGGTFRTVRPTPHFDAQRAVVRAFLGLDVEVSEEPRGSFVVEVPGRFGA